MTTSLDATYRPPPASPHPNNGHTNGSNGNGATALASPPAPPKPWALTDSTKLYGIHQWGQGYFSINEEGHVAVHPTQDPNLKVDLKKLVDELRERDIQLPMLIRFTDILRHRVGRLHEAFANAIRDHDYHGE